MIGVICVDASGWNIGMLLEEVSVTDPDTVDKAVMSKGPQLVQPLDFALIELIAHNKEIQLEGEDCTDITQCLYRNLFDQGYSVTVAVDL